jgi:predicted metal-dependent peptidase
MDKIQKAQIALLTGQGIFYASLMAQMNRIEGTKVLPEGALAAVLVQNGRINLFTNCELYEKFSLDQMCRILEHELMHIIMEHGSRCPEGGHKLWNMASDLAINGIIPGMDLGLIPGKDQFKDFPVGKSAEFYYGILKDKQDKGKLEIGPDGKVKLDGKEVKVDYCPSTEKGDSKSSDAEKLAKEVVKQAVAEAMAETSRTAGGPPAGLESIIDDLLNKNTINWKAVLRNYIGASVKCGSKSTWKRQSRRFGDTQKGKMPERILDVAVAIDTSGSIRDEDLQEFVAEMKGILKSYKSKIHVVECGTSVDRAYDLKPHTKINSKFFGRGGGDFRPTYEYFKEKRKKPNVLVYFTDMYEQFPEKETIKTLWVRPSQVDGMEPPKPPFGKILQIPRRDNSKTGFCPVCNQPGCNCNTAYADAR